MKKMRGIVIRRFDATIPMTEKEEKQGKRDLKKFVAWINNAIPPSHNICK